MSIAGFMRSSAIAMLCFIVAASALAIWSVNDLRVSGMLAVLALLPAALAVRFYLVLRRRVIEPLAALAVTADMLARGENAPVPYQDHRDEIGTIATSLEHFRAAAEARAMRDADDLAEQARISEALAKTLAALREGDLTQFVREHAPDKYAVLKDGINEAVDALRGMIQRVSESADGIRAGSTEIAEAAGDLARRTDESAAKVAQATEALREIDARLTASMVAADSTVDRADKATAAVDSGRDTAERAVQAMDRVSGSAKSIDGVIEGLDKIAFQTRVLAMNAAVEAGRAGDAGRGFAVVADLVSALAMRAEEESKHARNLLTATQADIIQAAEAVHETDSALVHITGDVEAVRALLGKMREDNHAQAVSVTGVADAMTSLDGVTQQNAAMVSQISTAIRRLSDEVAGLARHTGAFHFDRRQRDRPVPDDRRRPQAERPALISPQEPLPEPAKALPATMH